MKGLYIETKPNPSPCPQTNGVAPVGAVGAGGMAPAPAQQPQFMQQQQQWFPPPGQNYYNPPGQYTDVYLV